MLQETLISLKDLEDEVSSRKDELVDASDQYFERANDMWLSSIQT